MSKLPVFFPPVEKPGDDTVRANYKELFTVQERLIAADLIARQKIDFVESALNVENPERTYWLDRYLDLKRPKAEPPDSVVQAELRKYEMTFGIDTPAKAAFWEARLQLEREGKKLPELQGALKEAGLVEEVVETPVEEPVEAVVEPVVEPVIEKKKPGRPKKETDGASEVAPV